MARPPGSLSKKQERLRCDSLGAFDFLKSHWELHLHRVWQGWEELYMFRWELCLHNTFSFLTAPENTANKYSTGNS